MFLSGLFRCGLIMFRVKFMFVVVFVVVLLVFSSFIFMVEVI